MGTVFSSGLWRRVAHVRTEVLQLLVNTNVLISLILPTLMMEAKDSSETSVNTRRKWRRIPEDGILPARNMFLDFIQIAVLFPYVSQTVKNIMSGWSFVQNVFKCICKLQNSLFLETKIFVLIFLYMYIYDYLVFSKMKSCFLSKCCTQVLFSADFRTRKWLWYVPPKRQFTYGLHSIIYQKMTPFKLEQFRVLKLEAPWLFLIHERAIPTGRPPLVCGLNLEATYNKYNRIA
jgi:hypothetical protein